MIRTALIGLAACLLSAVPGRNLERLWNSFESARSKDKPQEQLDILSEIKAESGRERSAWDFYQACDKYVNVSGRVNWKTRDSLSSAMIKELEAFGEPVMLFYHDRSGTKGKELIETFRKELLASKNPEFWKNDYRVSGYSYSDALVENFSNDLDYACWAAGEDNFKGRYPLDALFEFSRIESGDTGAYADYAGRYKGRSVALLARGTLLQNKYFKLCNENGSSDDFIALKEECERFNAERKAFKGGEETIARCCTMADKLLEDLGSKDLTATIEDGTLSICFRNLRSAGIEILDGKKVLFSRTVDNPVCSFRRIDTVRYALPPMDDGDYRLICKSGSNKYESDYRKHTLSLATRRDIDGCQAFVVDYISGEPVEGRGFFPLEAGTKEYSYSFRDNTGVLHSTGKVPVSTAPLTVDLSDDHARRCTILTDRAFYAPGDTVRFKAVMYEGEYSLWNAGAGIRIKAALLDTRDATIAEAELVTNEFGSAAGEFKAVRSDRNGEYRLVLECEGKKWYKSIQVDDITLPDFDLVFEGGSNEQIEGIPDTISVRGTIASYSGHPLGSAKINYSIRHNWSYDDLASGILMPDPNGGFRIDFPSVKPESEFFYENYNITIKVVDATGETHEFNKTICSVRNSGGQKPDAYYFEDLGENSLSCRIVAGDKPVWAAVTLYGPGNVILDDRLIHFEPVNGVASTTVCYAYQDSYPDVVRMDILYFQNGNVYRHTLTSRRVIKVWDLPVSFSRFRDLTRPGAGYTFGIHTGPGVECAVTVFDKSTETVAPNPWDGIRPRDIPAPSPDIRCTTGQNRTVTTYMAKVKGTLRMAMEAENSEAIADLNMQQETVHIRENFANTLAWEPFLYSDANGDVSFTFRTSDKLSTYYVQVFAHNKAEQSGAARREMMVTIPVRVSVREPRFLYSGDRYTAHAAISNSLDTDVHGKVVFNDKEPVPVTVPAHAQTEVSCPITVEGTGAMPLQVVFIADDSENGSDGIKLSIPVSAPVQTVTEAHSSLLRPGQVREDVIRSLRAEFTNIPGNAAEVNEISILDMVNEALPSRIEPAHDDVLSLSDVIIARRLAGCRPEDAKTPDEEILKRIDACRNADGGYAWYAGMSSSPIITAALLERLGASLPEAGSAIKYLDRQFFTDKLPYWRGGLSMEQYLHARSLFSEVPFSEKPDKEFRKAVRKYLVPSEERGLSGMIFRKARRVETLRNLVADESGIKLVRQWGIGLFVSSRLTSSEKKDMESLAQYAVAHPSGGVYFPNAVMPWRGLLESELYAHNMLGRIFEGRDDSISNGIRLWTMIQKETQKWDSDPAYIEAIQNVLKAPAEILDTKVLALKATFTRPFSDIKASGNGLSISSKTPDGGIVGDKVTIEYTVHNDENRSFVKFSLPFPAGLIPVRQESGLYGWNGYRSVGKDRIEYWFDSYPEETTTIREEFYVSQEGSFQSPVPTVECLYADHYRANGDSPEILNTGR